MDVFQDYLPLYTIEADEEETVVEVSVAIERQISDEETEFCHIPYQQFDSPDQITLQDTENRYEDPISYQDINSLTTDSQTNQNNTTNQFIAPTSDTSLTGELIGRTSSDETVNTDGNRTIEENMSNNVLEHILSEEPEETVHRSVTNISRSEIEHETVERHASVRTTSTVRTINSQISENDEFVQKPISLNFKFMRANSSLHNKAEWHVIKPNGFTYIVEITKKSAILKRGFSSCTEPIDEVDETDEMEETSSFSLSNTNTRSNSESRSNTSQPVVAPVNAEEHILLNILELQFINSPNLAVYFPGGDRTTAPCLLIPNKINQWNMSVSTSTKLVQFKFINQNGSWSIYPESTNYLPLFVTVLKSNSTEHCTLNLTRATTKEIFHQILLGFCFAMETKRRSKLKFDTKENSLLNYCNSNSNLKSKFWF